MKAYSVDLRERVVAAVVEQGLARAQAAALFGLSVGSVGRFVRAWQAGGSLEPRRSSGRPRILRLAEHVAALREHFEAEPDLELSERCEYLARAEGVQLSVPTLWRAMRRLDWTRKKRL